MLTGSHEIFLLKKKKTRIKHWLAWMIKQPWSLLMWKKKPFTPLLCVIEEMKGNWVMGGGERRTSTDDRI